MQKSPYSSEIVERFIIARKKKRESVKNSLMDLELVLFF